MKARLASIAAAAGALLWTLPAAAQDLDIHGPHGFTDGNELLVVGELETAPTVWEPHYCIENAGTGATIAGPVLFDFTTDVDFHMLGGDDQAYVVKDGDNCGSQPAFTACGRCDWRALTTTGAKELWIRGNGGNDTISGADSELVDARYYGAFWEGGSAGMPGTLPPMPAGSTACCGQPSTLEAEGPGICGNAADSRRFVDDDWIYSYHANSYIRGDIGCDHVVVDTPNAAAASNLYIFGVYQSDCLWAKNNLFLEMDTDRANIAEWYKGGGAGMMIDGPNDEVKGTGEFPSNTTNPAVTCDAPVSKCDPTEDPFEDCVADFGDAATGGSAPKICRPANCCGLC